MNRGKVQKLKELLILPERSGVYLIQGKNDTKLLQLLLIL